MMYLTLAEYRAKGGTVLTDDTASKYLIAAQDAIDTLTFNRIVSVGFNNLTAFQRCKVKRCMAMVAEFAYENEDLLQSYVESYSINGVSATMGGNNLHCEGGVVVPQTAYNVLAQTGLCVRRFLR